MNADRENFALLADAELESLQENFKQLLQSLRIGRGEEQDPNIDQEEKRFIIPIKEYEFVDAYRDSKLSSLQGNVSAHNLVRSAQNLSNLIGNLQLAYAVHDYRAQLEHWQAHSERLSTANLEQIEQIERLIDQFALGLPLPPPLPPNDEPEAEDKSMTSSSSSSYSANP